MPAFAVPATSRVGEEDSATSRRHGDLPRDTSRRRKDLNILKREMRAIGTPRGRGGVPAALPGQRKQAELSPPTSPLTGLGHPCENGKARSLGRSGARPHHPSPADSRSSASDRADSARHARRLPTAALTLPPASGSEGSTFWRVEESRHSRPEPWRRERDEVPVRSGSGCTAVDEGRVHVRQPYPRAIGEVGRRRDLDVEMAGPSAFVPFIQSHHQLLARLHCSRPATRSTEGQRQGFRGVAVRSQVLRPHPDRVLLRG